MSFDVNEIKANFQAQAVNSATTNVNEIKTTSEEQENDTTVVIGGNGEDLKPQFNLSAEEIQKLIEETKANGLKEYQLPDINLKPGDIYPKLPGNPGIEPKDKEDPASKLSKVDRAYIDVMVEGDKELDEIKGDLRSSLEKAGYSEEEIAEKIDEAEAKYLEENPEYAESKAKFGDIKGDHDNYMNEQFAEWQKEHPAPDYATATQKELDDYQAEVMKFRSEKEAEYGKEHPEYAYYKQQSMPKIEKPEYPNIGDLILPDKPNGNDGTEIVIPKLRQPDIKTHYLNNLSGNK